MMRLQSIEEAVSFVARANSCAFLLGAGVSVPSGIPSAWGVIEDASRRFLGAPNEGAAKWLADQPFFDSKDPYGSVLEAAFSGRFERAKYFESLIAGKAPSRAHRAVAQLCKAGFCRAIVTTNFDRLMEYAAACVCGRFPCVWLTEEIPRGSVDSLAHGRPPIFKLHGDFLYGNIRNLGHELWLVKRSIKEKLRIAGRSGVLVVAGYSGSDVSVMTTLNDLAEEGLFIDSVVWLSKAGSPPNEMALRWLDRVRGLRADLDTAEDFIEPLTKALGSTSEIRDQWPDSRLSLLRHDWSSRLQDGDYLNGVHAEEFRSQLARNADHRAMASSPAGLDFLVACFLEQNELTRNIGQLLDRFIDLLFGASGMNGVSPAGDKRALRQRQIEALNLIDVSDPLFVQLLDSYLAGLNLAADASAVGARPYMLSDEGNLRALRVHVGLIENATAIISPMIGELGGLPGLHGRNRPWPEMFYHIADLIGCSNNVQLEQRSSGCD